MLGKAPRRPPVRPSVAPPTCTANLLTPLCQVRKPSERPPVRGREVRLHGGRQAGAPVEEASGGGARGCARYEARLLILVMCSFFSPASEAKEERPHTEQPRLARRRAHGRAFGEKYKNALFLPAVFYLF